MSGYRPTTPHFATAAMMIAIAAAWWLRPQPSSHIPARLGEVVPVAFGDWKEIDTALPPVDPITDRDTHREMNSPYDDVLMRAYANSRGEVVLLALAYGADQLQEVKIHRPELCYVAQGFKVLKHWPRAFTVPGQGASSANGERMLVQAPGRTEAVSYWIRIGHSYSGSAWDTRYYIFREGLKRRIVDGILVRVSQIVETPDAGVSDERYRIQERFIADLVSSMPAASRHLLVER